MKKLLFLIAVFPLLVHGQIITTFAGGGTSTPNGVLATTAQIPGPIGGVFDSHGNYYFVGYSTSALVYKIDITGIITVLAGTGTSGYNGDGGKADTSMLRQPYAVIVDTLDNIYIADAGNNRIRKVNASTGIISTVAGSDITGFGGDNGPATNANLNFPHNICFDKHGNLYIADGKNYRIRLVNTSGIITSYAGNGTLGTGGDGGPATLAQVVAYGLCLDDSNNLYFSAASVGQCRIGKINAQTHIVTTIAGTSTGYVYNGDNISPLSANMAPTTIRFDNAFLDLYITDNTNNRIRKIDANGAIHTVVGNGTQGFSGDNDDATNAELYYPSGITFDTCGNLYFGDQFNNRIRKVSFNPNCWPEGVTNTAATNNINIYPNPANYILTIEAGNTGTIVITDVIGKCVYSSYITERTQLSIKDWRHGIYYVQVVGEHGNRSVQKLVVQ